MKCNFCGLTHNAYKDPGWKCMPEKLAKNAQAPDNRYYEQLLRMSEFVKETAHTDSGKAKPYRLRFARMLMEASAAMKALEKADRNECGYTEDDVIHTIQFISTPTNNK